jgi:GDPmannose 4,6-dehydratase
MARAPQGTGMKRALITGITGQDGSYLAELLLSKGYEVHGLVRRGSLFTTKRIEHIFRDPHEEELRLFLHYGDLTDGGSLRRLVDRIRPDEVYNLAAQSHVKVSFEMPSYTCDVVGMGTVRLLEAVLDVNPRIRFYQASSSEMFGRAAEIPQTELTPFHPRSPYAAAKVFAYWMTVNAREASSLFACNGILFNHESPRRGETFVTRKISRGIANVLAGRQHRLYLGNLEAKRDWGYAKEYVEGMWLMLQQDRPDDYVLATGEAHTVREFLETCCEIAGLSSNDFVVVDPRYFRNAEVDLLVGDPSKAKRRLGWSPRVTFRDLCRLMLAADVAAVGLDPKTFGLDPPQDRAVV